MVTLIKVGAEVVNPTADYTGLYDDPRPVGAPNGSSYFAFDKGKIYFYDEEHTTWVDPTEE